jgi:hypothetical protein
VAESASLFRPAHHTRSRVGRAARIPPSCHLRRRGGGCRHPARQQRDRDENH